MSYADTIRIKLCEKLHREGHITEVKLKEMQLKHGDPDIEA